MTARRFCWCSALLLVLLVPRLAAHGYGTRPPWVAAGVVRVLAPGDDAYLEVRVQHSGHLGARRELSAPDMFRIVQLGAPGSARTTPRWERELQRRPLAAGDEVVGHGVLARAPLALALYPGGAALAVADRFGVTVQERSGDVRFHLPFYYLFWSTELEQATEEHDRNPVWPFGWLDAPPRTVAVWSDGTTLTAALRTRTGQWLVGCADATTGAVQMERPDAATLAASLAAALAAPAAPEASIALEALALGVPPSIPSLLTTIPDTPPAAAITAARQVITNERATVEARLVAAQVLARSALATATERSGLPPHSPSRAEDIELVAATALRVLQSGDGHPSMDDLLAAEVFVGLAPALQPERWAGPLTELALGRGVPELFPALMSLRAPGVVALADAWLAVDAGSLSPYADPRVTSHALVHYLARTLVAPYAGDGAGASGADPLFAALGRWLGESEAGERSRPRHGAATHRGRGVLLAALLTVEPTLDESGDAGPDVRALIVRALGAEHPAALDVVGPASRPLVGALVEALDAADRLQRLAPRGSPSEPDAERRARAADLAARASASLQRIADVPPPPFEPALTGAEVPVAIAEARRWTAWWRAAEARPQAAELAALVARGAGPEPDRWRRGPRRPDWPGAQFNWPGSALTRALAELFAEPRPDTWRVLERGLGEGLERVDELGLRGTLRRALGEEALDSASVPEEQAARERVQRALGRTLRHS